MKFEINDVVRVKGASGAASTPEMTVVLEEKDGNLTCNWNDENGRGQIWVGTPNELELVRRTASIDLDNSTNPQE